MEIEELLKQLLQAEVAKAAPKSNDEPAAAPKAPEAAPAAEPLTAEAMRSIIAEEVAKALPARPAEGAGTRSESADAKKAAESNPALALVELVKKAATTPPEQLTQAEKRAIWTVTHRALSQGLKKDDSVE